MKRFLEKIILFINKYKNKPKKQEYFFYTTWKLNGKLHREDGPAVEFADGSSYWYLNGVEYTKEEYTKQLFLINL